MILVACITITSMVPARVWRYLVAGNVAEQIDCGEVEVLVRNIHLLNDTVGNGDVSMEIWGPMDIIKPLNSGEIETVFRIYSGLSVSLRKWKIRGGKIR